MCLVSVILPVYNCEKYLSEAIKSILNQSFQEFELVIINDGSTDKSSEIINSFSDPRIVRIDNPENLKLIQTLNLGIKLAKGKYIARMDADDIATPDRLKLQFEFLENNESYVLVGGNYDAFGDRKFTSVLPEKHDQIKLTMNFYNPIAHPTVMIRKNVIDQHNLEYNPSHLHCEDWGLWLQLIQFGKFHNLPNAVLKYRINNESVSIQNRDSHKLRYQLIYQEIFARTMSETEISPEIMNFHYGLYFGPLDHIDPKEMANYINWIEKKLLQNNKESFVEKWVRGIRSAVFYRYMDSSNEQAKIFLKSAKIRSAKEKYVLLKSFVRTIFKLK